MLSFPRLQLLCALMVLLAVSLLLPDRFGWMALSSSTLAAAALAYQCFIFMPWTPLYRQQVAAAKDCPDGNALRLFEVNVEMTNEHAEKLFQQIERTKPDVILVEEVDHWWHDHLESLYDQFPYHLNIVQQNYYGIALLSRYQLVDPRVLYMANSRDPAVFTGISLPAGSTVRLYGVHPRPPTLGQSSAERDAILMDAALHMADADGSKIVAGDFNAVPWSPVVRRLARIAHLNDPRIGRGWFPTWKANGVALRWPLDHALFTKDFTLSEYRVLPPIGSDHQPILTTVCFAPKAMQTAPQTTPGDMAAARQAIAVGQGQAAPSPGAAPGKQTRTKAG